MSETFKQKDIKEHAIRIPFCNTPLVNVLLTSRTDGSRYSTQLTNSVQDEPLTWSPDGG